MYSNHQGKLYAYKYNINVCNIVGETKNHRDYDIAQAR